MYKYFRIDYLRVNYLPTINPKNHKYYNFKNLKNYLCNTSTCRAPNIQPAHIWYDLSHFANSSFCSAYLFLFFIDIHLAVFLRITFKNVCVYGSWVNYGQKALLALNKGFFIFGKQIAKSCAITYWAGNFISAFNYFLGHDR